MNSLKTYKFHTLYDFSSGISSKPEQAGHGSPFVSFSTVFNNYFVPNKLNELMDTSLEEQEKYSILKGDILLTRTSETVDELAMSCVAIKDYPNVTYSGFLKRLRPLQNNVTYDKYMAFYLRSKLFRKTMTNNAVLTLRASLNEQIFSYLDLVLPKYEEQVKIGNLLYSINQKIELNNKINQELEAMTKTLYDYWFVQFDFPNEEGTPYKSSGGKMVYSEELKRDIPEGWEVDILSNIMDIVSGYPFSSSDYLTDGTYKIITIKNVQDGELMLDKVNCINSIPEGLPSYCLLNLGDILISLTGNIGRIALVDDNYLLLNQRVGKFITDAKYLKYMHMFFLRQENRTRLETIAGGSSQANLSPVDAVKMNITIPNEIVLSSFNSIINPIYNKVLLYKVENRKLTQLRDWLLPMLMNGQVSVADATEQIDELMVAEPKQGYGES